MFRTRKRTFAEIVSVMKTRLKFKKKTYSYLNVCNIRGLQPLSSSCFYVLQQEWATLFPNMKKIFSGLKPFINTTTGVGKHSVDTCLLYRL